MLRFFQCAFRIAVPCINLLKHPVLVLLLAFALAARVFSFFPSAGLADRSVSGSSLFSGDGDIVLYGPSVMSFEA
jgi:hypothetical protein